MLLCYCTQSAPRVPVDYFKDNVPFEEQVWQWNTSWWEFTRPQTIILKADEFDRNRYELVEKKDWKIKDTEKRLEHTKSLMRSNSDEITRLQYLETEYAKEWNLLEKELKELKKE